MPPVVAPEKCRRRQISIFEYLSMLENGKSEIISLSALYAPRGPARIRYRDLAVTWHEREGGFEPLHE